MFLKKQVGVYNVVLPSLLPCNKWTKTVQNIAVLEHVFVYFRQRNSVFVAKKIVCNYRLLMAQSFAQANQFSHKWVQVKKFLDPYIYNLKPWKSLIAPCRQDNSVRVGFISTNKDMVILLNHHYENKLTKNIRPTNI